MANNQLRRKLKKLLENFCLFLMVVTTPIAFGKVNSDWVVLSSLAQNDSNTEGTSYYSKRSIEKLNGREYIVLTVADIKKRPLNFGGVSVRSILTEIHIKCDVYQARPTSVVLRSGPMGTGDTLDKHRETARFPFQKVAEHSPSGQLLSVLCK
jgi:hypothetical protein